MCFKLVDPQVAKSYCMPSLCVWKHKVVEDTVFDLWELYFHTKARIIY